jgi:hypothetical protein
MRLTAAIVVGTVFAATPVAAQTPGTLSGELLTGAPQVTSSCNVTGNSTISYSVSGVSSAPYPGTFTESGVATIGAQPNPGNAVLVTSFSASFVITSGQYEITGTKVLTQDVYIATGLGFCTDFLRSFGIAAIYDARIKTPDGIFADRGKAGVALNEGEAYDPSQFTEFFQSDLSAPEPVPAEAAKVTGGGSLVDADASSGFVVQRKIAGGAITGEWQFVNRATGDVVHSVAITELAVAGNTATFSGLCRNERAGAATLCWFWVTVVDNGEGSQAAPDTYSVTGQGFTGASGVVKGNVKIQ